MSATQTAANTSLLEVTDEVDVVIVGSGPTGAAYARILSEQAPHATIALFEVGPTVSDPPGSHVKNIVDPIIRAQAQTASEGPDGGTTSSSTPAAIADRRARPGTYLLPDGFQAKGEDGLPAAAFSSNVGGMSAHWTGACPRPLGAERISFLPDLDDLLADADRLLGVSRTAFDGSTFGTQVRARLAATVDRDRPHDARVQPMPLAVHRRGDGALVWSGSDVVFGDRTRMNPHFRLFDNSLVTEIVRVDGHVAGVIVRDQNTGIRRLVAAKYVVVAADALRTPQLLWASQIRPPALGRMLNDQTQVVIAARLEEPAPHGHPPTSAGTLTEASGVSWVPFTNDHPFHGQVMQLDASPVSLIDGPDTASIVGIGLFCAKELQWDDRVSFSDDTLDGYGMPAIRIHYTLTDSDHASLSVARDRILHLAKAVGTPLSDEPITMPLGASLHYQGTVRMGEVDDGTSVCDPNSEVWSTRGLFVAGNGVIPTATACNPTLTAVALAIRGARHLAQQLNSRSTRAATHDSDSNTTDSRRAMRLDTAKEDTL